MRTRILVAVVAVFLMGAAGDSVDPKDVGREYTEEQLDDLVIHWPTYKFIEPTTVWTDVTVKKMKGTEEVETGFGEIDWSRRTPDGAGYVYCKPCTEEVPVFSEYEIGLRSDGVVVWREAR